MGGNVQGMIQYGTEAKKIEELRTRKKDVKALYKFGVDASQAKWAKGGGRTLVDLLEEDTHLAGGVATPTEVCARTGGNPYHVGTPYKGKWAGLGLL